MSSKIQGNRRGSQRGRKYSIEGRKSYWFLLPSDRGIAGSPSRNDLTVINKQKPKNGTSIQKVSNIKAIQRDERNRRTLPSVWPDTRAGVNNLFSKVRGAINQNGTKVVTSRQYTREKYEHNALANWSVWFGFRSD